MPRKGISASTKPSQQSLPKINSKRAVNMVMEMMAIPGKSGEEGKIAEYIRKKLIAAGVPKKLIVHDSANKKSPHGGEVGNLIVKLPGTVRGPRRMMMGHIDTVPLCVGAQPVRRGDIIASKDPETALGGDDRAGAAVVLNTILEIQEQKLPYPPLTLFWPVQEEIGLYGARHVAIGKLGKPKLCFNWDGRDPAAACIGATGDYAIAIEVTGIASHAGGHPEQGVNALGIVSLAMADLIENGWHGLIVKGKNRGSSNIGVVSGGDATNVVLPKVTLKAEARSHNPTFRKRIVEEFRKAFVRATKRLKNNSGKTGSVNFSADLKYDSFELNAQELCVQQALAAISTVGLRGATGISNGGLDANWMNAHGLPTVTMGCGQQEIHTVKETLHIKSFLQACEIGLVLGTGCVE